MKWGEVKATMAVLFVGGVLAGAVIAALRAFLPRWTMLSILPYSPPMLLLEGLVVLHIAFWLRPLMKLSWFVSGLLLGLFAQSAALFPYDLHTLLPYHWSALITSLGALAGMGLGKTHPSSLPMRL